MSDEVEKKPVESRVSCRVSVEVLARLESIATANGISVSDVVRMAIHRTLPTYEQVGHLPLAAQEVAA